MNEVKRQLNQKIGDTKARSEKIIQMVEENKKTQRKKSSKLYYATFATFAALLAVLLYINPFETLAPTTSTPTPNESAEQTSLNLKNLFKQDGDVAYFEGMYSEYANFTETTTWLNDSYVQLSIKNSAIETRKFYRITDEAIYLVYEDQPEMDGHTEMTIEKLEKMEPISTLLTADLFVNDLPANQLITYPTKLNTPLQQFENVIQVTQETEYGITEFFYAENYGLIGQIYESEVFSLLVSINEEPSHEKLTLPVINSQTNEKETLHLSEMSAIDPLITYHPQLKNTTMIYTPIHSDTTRELGIIEIDLPQQYDALTVVRAGNTISIIGSSAVKLVDWSYSPNNKRVALFYSNGHEWENADFYQPDILHVVNLQDMSYESSTNDFERNWYAYPILSYNWLNNSTIEYVVPDVSSPLPQLFLEWKQLNKQQTTTFQAKFTENTLSSKTALTEDFDTYFYESDRYTLYLHDGELKIWGLYHNDDRNSIIDEVVLAEEISSPFFNQTYSNAKVEVNENRYVLTADGIPPLTFTIFMDHIIVDAFGMEYIRKEK